MTKPAHRPALTNLPPQQPTIENFQFNFTNHPFPLCSQIRSSWCSPTGHKSFKFFPEKSDLFYKWAERARYTLWLRSLGTTTARTVGLSLRARYHYRNWADGFSVDYYFEIFCYWVVKHRLYLIFVMTRFLIPIYVLGCVAVSIFWWEKSFNPRARSLFDLHLDDFFDGAIDFPTW